MISRRLIPFCVPAILVLTLMLFILPVQASGPKGGLRVIKPQNKPFLILGKLPHLTLHLMSHWDDPKLGLSDDQKKLLLEIRKKTISQVKSLAKEISQLEDMVVQGANSGKTPEELAPLVKKIAELKTKATMVQLRCIFDTKKILSPGQLQYLLQTSQKRNPRKD